MSGTIGMAIKNLFTAAWNLLKIPLFIVIGILAAIILIYVGNVLYFRIVKKLKNPGTEHYKVKRESLLSVLWNGMRQTAYDNCTRNIEHIPERWTGIYMIEGLPGCGKSTTAVWDTLLKKKEYPKLKVYTNMGVDFEDGSIDSWKDLMKYDNEEWGMVYIIDEISTVISSKSWRDTPIEALELCTQSRKRRVRILTTTQDFKQAHIDFRRLCKEVWKPVTLGKSICFVIKYRPLMNSEGEIEKKKFIGIDYYRNSNIRNSFDTRKQIKKLLKEGFAPKESQTKISKEHKPVIEVKTKK